MIGDVAPLDGWIVEVVEVIDHRNTPAAGKQAVNEMASDKPCPARYERVFRHGISLGFGSTRTH